MSHRSLSPLCSSSALIGGLHRYRRKETPVWILTACSDSMCVFPYSNTAGPHSQLPGRGGGAYQREAHREAAEKEATQQANRGGQRARNTFLNAQHTHSVHGFI